MTTITERIESDPVEKVFLKAQIYLFKMQAYPIVAIVSSAANIVLNVACVVYEVAKAIFCGLGALVLSQKFPKAKEHTLIAMRTVVAIARHTLIMVINIISLGTFSVCAHSLRSPSGALKYG